VGKKTEKASCFMGVHSVPENSIYESYGAIFLGGLCRRCGDLAQGKFLYNSWEGEVEGETVVTLTGTNPQLIEDTTSGKYVWDEKYYGKE
jgi:hypothetical protein